MEKEWINIPEIKNIRYKKHPTRKVSKRSSKPDRYFSGKYQVNGKIKNIGFGWESEGWTPEIVKSKIDIYKLNAKTGKLPTTLKEEYAIELEKRETEIKKLDPENPDNITFYFFFENIYLPMAKVESDKTTVRNIESYVNKWLKPVIGDLKLNEITNVHFEDLKINMLERGKSNRTLEQCFAIFSLIWTYAQKRGLVEKIAPTKHVTRPRVENKAIRFFTVEEAKLLFADLKYRSINVHDMVLLSINTGARRGEIFDLTWSVINFENGSVCLRDAKGNTRDVYFGDSCFSMLKRRHKNQLSPTPSDLVFQNINGKRFTEVPRSYNSALTKLKFNHGVTDRRDRVTFHTCRHTFASWHVQYLDTNLYVLKTLMGHSTVKLTERYANLGRNRPKIASDHFNNFVEKEFTLPALD